MNILLNTQKPNGERYGWKVAWHTENDGLHNFIVDGDSVFNDTASIWVYAMVDTGGGSLNYIGGHIGCLRILPPGFHITSPEGGNILVQGTTHAITWRTIGSFPNVWIGYSTDGCDSWHEIAPSTPNVGTYNWAVPAVTSNACHVSVKQATGGSLSDRNEAAFSIVSPSISVTTPNGGESWLSGSTHTS